MVHAIDQPALGERHPCSGAVADDDVVVQVQVQESRGIRELPRQAQVLTRGSRVAARVVVDQDDAGRAFPEGRSQDLAWVHERRRLRPERDQRVQKVVVLGIQEDGPEVFLVVVVLAQEVAGELRDGGRATQRPGRRRSRLAHDRPCCELQPIATRRHDRTAAPRGRSPSSWRSS